MSGTFAAKVLADGLVANAQGAIYTVPALSVTYVKQIFLNNVNAATQTIQLWLNTSGAARRWKVIQLAQDESCDVLEDGEAVTLEAGDTIEAVTTTTSAVPFTITGVVET